MMPKLLFGGFFAGIAVSTLALVMQGAAPVVNGAIAGVSGLAGALLIMQGMRKEAN